MSLAARIPEIELHSSAIGPLRVRTVSPVREAWAEVDQQDLPFWDGLLLETDSWIYQYPFWNEPLRAMGLTPRYLAWGEPGHPLAFVCILTLGFRPAKIGLVFRGPTCLQAGAEIPRSALAELLHWGRDQGYMFIRFTHSNPEMLSHIAANGDARDIDVFPYFQDYPIQSPDFVVTQSDSEEETLAGFDREVRRKLRRASEMGYEFRSDDSPEALAKLWPLYQECSRRKGFRLERPLSVYLEMLRQARPHNSARVYSVLLDGKAVGSAVVVRDGNSAHCVLAAFAHDHRQSAAFLHWKSMRDMFQLGARKYNLGPGPGSLARFKQQFAAQRLAYPGPLTMVLNRSWFQVWWKALYPVAKHLRPVLVGAFSRACL
jgi:Acetyltransferase (GNAT) domain